MHSICKKRRTKLYDMEKFFKSGFKARVAL